VKSCTLLIAPANDFVACIHDRMPVLLSQEQFEPWLKGEAGMEILKPAANDFLQRWPVSQRVNSSRADTNDPTLIDAVEFATTAQIV
jgi:putative SOS response-associated peptidase YedK